MAEDLIVARRDGVHVLTLNRPDRLNAFTSSLHDALRAALDAAEHDPDCRAILLHGAGRGFCAGQDLTEIQPGADLGETLERRFNPLIRHIHAIPKPVVAAVHGVAAGAGANLALACDIVLAARSARFLQAFIKIGLIPDAGGTWILPRLAGSARARALAMLGEPVEAAQAEQWGLIWRAVPDDDLMPEAEHLAIHLATQPTHAIGLIKRALDAAEANGLDQQLDLERDLQREAGRTPDFQEGVRAFLEKRPARFTGRPGVTPDALAQACARQMWAADRASAGLGMTLESVSPGAARLAMPVAPHMLNGYGTCHGGFIFALADSAFAFACNTDGMVSVAAHCSISYLRPVRLGETLIAAAQERQREGRGGIYDVRITSGDAVVAEFRGHSRTTGEALDVARAG